MLGPARPRRLVLVLWVGTTALACLACSAPSTLEPLARSAAAARSTTPPVTSSVTSPATSTSSRTPTRTTRVTPVTGLAAQILPAPDDASDAEDPQSMGLDAFVAKFYARTAQSSSRTWLHKCGFAEAASGEWVTESNSLIQIFLIRFESARGAAVMARDLAASWGDDKAPATTFTDSVISAFGEVKPTPDADGDTLVKMIGVSGHVVIYLRQFTPHKPDRSGTQTLMHSQYRRVEAHGGSSGDTASPTATSSPTLPGDDA